MDPSTQGSLRNCITTLLISYSLRKVKSNNPKLINLSLKYIFDQFLNFSSFHHKCLEDMA